MIRKIQSAADLDGGNGIGDLRLRARAVARAAPNSQAEAEEEEALARTEFTERIENFFEYGPLKAGKPSQFLIHLTDLSDGAPVEQAEVTLTVRAKSGGPKWRRQKRRSARSRGFTWRS